MNAELMEKARVGLQAWQDGDLSALEELLDVSSSRSRTRSTDRTGRTNPRR